MHNLKRVMLKGNMHILNEMDYQTEIDILNQVLLNQIENGVDETG
ncbi:hypothetical protein [Lysinibacillus sp. SGAir0095]|nr:hypothetical protein [Lysinibacillus sp. SGAir0095]